MDDEDEESGEDEVSASDDGEDDGEADGEDDDDDDGDAEAAAAKEAAVALSLGVGSLSDPKELQGCAHFVEHMLFLGNKKFPGENEWATFLSDHGGEDNGETSWETTTFYFDVEPKYLKPALERFAAFFVAPTFDFDASEREVKAIESEFQQAKHRDGDRVSQLRCHLCADGHPHKGFGWGDARSLVDQPAAAGVDVRAQMHKFHESHYSANLMTAVVVGFESLDGCRRSPSTRRADLRPRRCALPWRRTGAAAAGGAAGRRPRGAAEEGQPRAPWSLPPLRPHVRAKPAEYVEHLLGHEEGRPRAAEGARARHLALRGRRGRRGDECARPLLCHGRARGGTRRRRWRRLCRPRRLDPSRAAPPSGGSTTRCS